MTYQPLEGQIIPGHAGAPSKYKPEMVEQVIELMTQGKTNAQICAYLDISADSFMRYRRQFPELAAAYELGESARQAVWEHTAMQLAKGELKGNAQMMIFLMSNMFKKDYQTKTDSVQVNINNNNVKALSDEELEEQVARLMLQQSN